MSAPEAAAITNAPLLITPSLPVFVRVPSGKIMMPVPFLHSFVSFSTVVVSPLPRSMETAPMQRRNQPASGFLNSSSLARMRSRFQSNIVIAIKTGSRLAMWFGAMT